MTIDPTTPEGRAAIRERVSRAQAALGDIRRCEIRGWAPAKASYRSIAASQADVSALLDALDDAECEIERQRGDLVIERRRSGVAEAALDRVRAAAEKWGPAYGWVPMWELRAALDGE